jgi:phosphate transport system substrate-binding protein
MINPQKRAIFISLLIIFSLSFLTSCSHVKKALQIKGSDTMVNLAQGWAEAYLNKYPLANIAVTGGGSGTGVAALIAGVADVAQSSREMQEKEIQMALAKGVHPEQIHVANDGIAVIVNPRNPVNKLTREQLSGIFSGKITNWKEVGGQDLKIVALSRERNSGTHVFFLEHVVKLGNKKDPTEFACQVLMMPSSQAIAEEVIANPSAIGYIGLGYLSKQEKALAIANDKQNGYVYPTVENVLAKKYPVSRALYFYTNGEPSGDIKVFVDFVLSKAGQEIVLKMDFVPIR